MIDFNEERSCLACALAKVCSLKRQVTVALAENPGFFPTDDLGSVVVSMLKNEASEEAHWRGMLYFALAHMCVHWSAPAELEPEGAANAVSGEGDKR